MKTAAALLLALLLLPAAHTVGQEHKEKPFPVAKSTILREGLVRYTVSGKVTIPEGVEISVQKNVYIIAKAEGATIRVEGALKVHGVGSREVIFEGITIELAPKVKDVHLDMAIFRNGGGVTTEPRKSTVGKLFIENVTFSDSAALDVTFAQGSIDLSSTDTQAPTRIRTVRKGEKDKSKVRVNVRGSGLHDLTILGADDATVRLSRLTGTSAVFRDCRVLTFDGNKVNAKTLEIGHSTAGGLAKTRITKCDIYSETVTIHAPKKDGRSVDKVVIDRCWFKGETNPKVVRKRVLKDASNTENNGAKISLGKLMKRPNELAGAIDR